MTENSVSLETFLLVLFLAVLVTLIVAIGGTSLFMKKRISKYKQELKRYQHPSFCGRSRSTHIRESLPGLRDDNNFSTVDAKELQRTRTVKCEGDLNDWCEDIFESVVVYDRPEGSSIKSSGQQSINGTGGYEDVAASALGNNACQVRRHFHNQNKVMLPIAKPIVPPKSGHFCNITLTHSHVYDTVLPNTERQNYKV